MRCYLCRVEITKAHRHEMIARDRREKDQFRDLCETCFPRQMDKEGYIKNINTWIRKEG